MVFLKKYYSVKANSILESVIALTIISICLYFAILIFASVFTPRTSAKFYNTQNKVNELFFLSQLKNDSLQYESANENLLIEEEIVNDHLKKISVQYKDSTQFKFEKSFYVENNP
ncbi:hypothetical protein [Flavobacterium pectinovorum]|uniref:Type II secretion system protein n=1 Tax=Flavobacterium pectinovorum TaxID=29533 RepID=A0AB36NV29_9FLAO|nr:hypothetical protein [Flavobacterium pectinovorum]OXA99550.1 hypothetical protein B0A72_22145 [Flavobacterium pectinovorum]SHN09297.1 hypothetical protein SAMN05444387_4056 [Flavobacterium pectinovorum]